MDPRKNQKMYVPSIFHLEVLEGIKGMTDENDFILKSNHVLVFDNKVN